MFFKILKNIGLVISSVKAIEEVIGNIVKNKTVSKDDIKKFLSIAESLLDSGLIDIPGVDEQAISDALRDVEKNI